MMDEATIICAGSLNDWRKVLKTDRRPCATAEPTYRGNL